MYIYIYNIYVHTHPYACDTELTLESRFGSNVPLDNGQHIIQVVLHDLKGHVLASASVNITVGESCPTMNETLYTGALHAIHKYTHPYIHTYMHTYIYPYKQIYTHTYIHTYIHTYRHTHIRIYIHTYMHTYMHAYLRT